MKLAIDEAIEIEMDSWAIEQAQKTLNEMKSKYKDRQTGEVDHVRFDSVMRAIFTVLFFGQLERQQPGVTQRMMEQATSLAKAMSPPEPSAT